MSDLKIQITCYLRTTPAKLWLALTDADLTEKFWGGTRLESDWQVGSKLYYRRNGKVTDEQTIFEIVSEKKLRHSFNPMFGEFKNEASSRVTFTIDHRNDVVRLIMVHDQFAEGSLIYLTCKDAWPMILSSLKSLLETGNALPECDFSQ